MTFESQPVPGEHPAAHLARLRKQGLTVKKAAETVGVSERHAYRLLENFDERPLMFERWSPSIADRLDTPEKIEWLFETCMDGAWWVEDAEIAWSIHCAAEDLEPWIVKAFCRLYVAAKLADPVTGIRNRMIIDWALWYRIWESPESAWDFVQNLPIATSEEMDYAADLSHYLFRYAPEDLNLAELATESMSRPRVQTVIDGIDDRWAYFNEALDRIQKNEQRMIEETPAEALPVFNVPGELKVSKRRKPRR